MSTVSFDLLIRGNGAEDDLSKLTTVKGTVCDAARPDLEVAHNQRGGRYVPNDLKRLLHNGHREMCPVIHQSGYVIFWHLRKLLLKDAFQPCQYYQALPFAIIIDYSEFDIAISFLRNRRLVVTHM